MTTPTPDEICERLRLAVRENTGWEPSMSVLERAADEAADLIQQQLATIEKLSAALERAIEAIQTERDCLVECATTPPKHDLSTLDPDTKPHVEEYDAMLAYLRAAHREGRER